MSRVIRPQADTPGAKPSKRRSNDAHYEGLLKRTKYDTRPGMVDVEQARAGKHLIIAGWLCWPVGIAAFLGLVLVGLGETPLLPLIIGLLMVAGPAMHTIGKFINWYNWG